MSDRINLCAVLVFAALSFISFFPSAGCAQPDVQVELNPSSGTEQDTFQYTIIASGGSKSNKPRLEPSNDFASRFVGSSSNIQIVNGRTSAEVRYLFELTPRKTGSLKTPLGKIFAEGREQNIEPLTVSVRKASTKKKQNKNQDVRLERELSEKQVFEGEQLTTTLKLYSRLPVQKGSFDDLTYDGFWKENLEEPKVRRIQQGRSSASVHEVKHALFPLQSGAIELPPATLRLVVRQPARGVLQPFQRLNPFDPDFFGFSRLQNLTVRSEPTTLYVRKLPPVPKELKGERAHPHIPVGDVKISLGFNLEPIILGEGKTVIVTISSNGNIRPIGELDLQTPDWVKVYNDAPEEIVSMRKGKFYLKKKFRLSLVPEKAGTVELPGISLLSFQPRQEKYKVIKSRPFAFEVKPNGATSSLTEATNGSSEVLQSEQTAERPAQLVFRYQEETLLEYLARTITLSLSLFLFTLTLLLFGTLRFYRQMRMAPKEVLAVNSLSGLERAKTPIELREEFIRKLSAKLSGDSNEVFRGFHLEKKLEEHLSDDSLREAISRHLDKLDSLSYSEAEGATEQQLDSFIQESHTLLEQLG